MNDIAINEEDNSIEVPHLGLTLRVLLSVAAKGYESTGRRRWNLMYKDCQIGQLQVKTKWIE